MPNHQYQSLVDLNPDRVFEEHTIAEIKEILKKLHAEIERKRVEIRTMVGYVDAISLVENEKIEFSCHLFFVAFLTVKGTGT